MASKNTGTGISETKAKLRQAQLKEIGDEDPEMSFRWTHSNSKDKVLATIAVSVHDDGGYSVEIRSKPHADASWIAALKPESIRQVLSFQWVDHYAQWRRELHWEHDRQQETKK